MNKNLKLVGTLHQTHEQNPNYSYQHLIQFVKAFKPDIIAVEIRQEDLGEPIAYLKQHYPPEMVMPLEGKMGQATILGFDWRGYQMAGKRMDDHSEDSPKVWDIMADYPKVKELVMMRKALMVPFFLNCTMANCQEGYEPSREDAIEKQLQETLYAIGYGQIADQQEERKVKIQENIGAIVKANPTAKIVILTGRAHLKHIRPYLLKNFGTEGRLYE